MIQQTPLGASPPNAFGYEHQPIRIPGPSILTCLCVLGYALALSFTISSASLSTDEAFSTYLACHRSFQSMWLTLVGGDSSDLQASMHYLYVHAWLVLFGSSEIALRASNIPFILLFSAALVWVSQQVFASRWLWILPGSLPFLWIFATQLRAYFALLAFATVFYSALLAYLSSPGGSPGAKERRVLPWLVLGSLFLGTTFHMLMLLTVAPAIVLVLLLRYQAAGHFRWQDWRPAALAFTLPFAALALYLLWTFGRGTAYDYDRPSLTAMVSILLQFLGVSGYRSSQPNQIGWNPQFVIFCCGLGMLATGLAALVFAGLRSLRKDLFTALAAALFLALVQSMLLSVAIHQQFEVRHLAAVVPLLLLLSMAAIAGTTAGQRFSLATVALVLLLVCWSVGDARLLTQPEYQVEDYRGTILDAIHRNRAQNADIVVLADPIASAYYGLNVQGEKPCFPLATSCEDGFALVDWPHLASARYGLWWDQKQVQTWLADHHRRHIPTIVVKTIWHPFYERSAWWPVLQSQPNSIKVKHHGFWIYELE